MAGTDASLSKPDLDQGFQPGALRRDQETPHLGAPSVRTHVHAGPAPARIRLRPHPRPARLIHHRAGRRAALAFNGDLVGTQADAVVVIAASPHQLQTKSDQQDIEQREDGGASTLPCTKLNSETVRTETDSAANTASNAAAVADWLGRATISTAPFSLFSLTGTFTLPSIALRIG